MTEETRGEPEAGAHVQGSPRVPLKGGPVRGRRVLGPLVELLVKGWL